MYKRKIYSEPFGVCDECGKDFVREVNFQRYCSRKCNNHHKNRIYEKRCREKYGMGRNKWRRLNNKKYAEQCKEWTRDWFKKHPRYYGKWLKKHPNYHNHYWHFYAKVGKRINETN